MKVISWNVRRAGEASAVWEYLLEVDPAIALLQEVKCLPTMVQDRFNVLTRPAVKETGSSQSFNTAIITKFPIDGEITLQSDREWVTNQADFFRGNLVGAELVGPDQKRFHVVSVHTPAWPVAKEKWSRVDVSGLKLAANPDIWCTEILWDALRCTMPELCGQWIVGGDFNSSETFDFRAAGDRGNREIMSRMNGLGLTEVLGTHHGRLVPTFRNPRGGQIVHQIDHLYVTASLCDRLVGCKVGSEERIFGQGMSDHLPIVAEFETSE
jgi:endonuclease/exonuclease/phosphatase family metal-dependent hydrolase